jgi:hypothetical protein
LTEKLLRKGKEVRKQEKIPFHTKRVHSNIIHQLEKKRARKEKALKRSIHSKVASSQKLICFERKGKNAKQRESTLKPSME